MDKNVLKRNGKIELEMAEVEGLFDFANFGDIVNVLAQVLNLSKDEVCERLFWEAMKAGWNVRRGIEEFGVTPFVYDERMERFYQRSNSLVFELIVWHLRDLCQEWDRRVNQEIAAQFRNDKDIDILVLGDGIGTESLRLAAMGYRVCYFEFAGPSATLALHRFKKQGLKDKIKVIHDLNRIPLGSFDVVVCTEVLEHVPDPPAVVANMWNYLKPKGVAIITEAFRSVLPQYPTHLEANLKYDGKTTELFLHAGFRFLKIFPGGKPFVFQKTDRGDLSRFRELRRARRRPLQWFVRQIGKRAIRYLPF